MPRAAGKADHRSLSLRRLNAALSEIDPSHSDVEGLLPDPEDPDELSGLEEDTPVKMEVIEANLQAMEERLISIQAKCVMITPNTVWTITDESDRSNDAKTCLTADGGRGRTGRMVSGD